LQTFDDEEVPQKLTNEEKNDGKVQEEIFQGILMSLIDKILHDINEATKDDAKIKSKKEVID